MSAICKVLLKTQTIGLYTTLPTHTDRVVYNYI
jgi:hypothetical protein